MISCPEERHVQRLLQLIAGSFFPGIRYQYQCSTTISERLALMFMYVVLVFVSNNFVLVEIFISGQRTCQDCISAFSL